MISRLKIVTILILNLVSWPVFGFEFQEKAMSNQAKEMSTFRYSTKGGMKFGGDLFERDTTFLASTRDNLLIVEHHRSESDAPDEPIGLFEMKIDAVFFNRIRSAFDSPEFASVESLRTSGSGESVLSYTFESPEKTITKQIGSRDVNNLKRCTQLAGIINEYYPLVLQHPKAAIRTETRLSPGGFFEFVVTNVGNEAVLVPSPRSLQGINDQDDWAGVRVAAVPPERPGVTDPPLRWSFVPFEQVQESSKTAIPYIRLEPGQSYTLKTKKWKPKSPSLEYLAEAVMSHYESPARRDGVYIIRGAVFSDTLEIPPGKTRP